MTTYTHPAPMSKEDMVKVLDALELALPHIRGSLAKTKCLKSITIMQSAIEGMK